MEALHRGNRSIKQFRERTVERGNAGANPPRGISKNCCQNVTVLDLIIALRKVQKMLLSQRSVDAVAQARTDFEQVPGIALMPWSEIPAPAQ